MFSFLSLHSLIDKKKFLSPKWPVKNQHICRDWLSIPHLFVRLLPESAARVYHLREASLSLVVAGAPEQALLIIPLTCSDLGIAGLVYGWIVERS